MDNDKQLQELKERHKTSIKGIYTMYVRKKMLCSCGLKISVLFSVLLCIFLSTVDDFDFFSLLEKIIALNISAFPNLLGFCVGGYALIIGFGHKEMLQKMSEPLPKRDDMSYFQVASSIFAASIIIQIVTFLLSLIISYIIDIGFHTSNECIYKFVNISTITIICFLTIYSVILIYYMVINIFTFGQMMHFCIRQELLEKKTEKDTQTNNKKIKPKNKNL